MTTTRTADSVRAAVSAALNPLVDISGCPDTVADVATDAALHQAYWALREHASSYRATEVFQRRQRQYRAVPGDVVLARAACVDEWYARGIEAAARDIAELIGVPECEIDRGAADGVQPRQDEAGEDR